MLSLDIPIITHESEGIKRLASNVLPRMENVRYIISWQSHADAPIPSELIREDIVIYRYDGIGLAANRNNSISHCDADIILISDDDIVLFEDGIRQLRRFYEDNPDADFVCFRSLHDSGVRYPEGKCQLDKRLPKGYSVASFELSFRRQTAGWLRCCPELGLGSARLHGGEDEMLLQSAIRKGLNCWFAPITVCAHDHPSTGTKAHLSKENIRAAGCVIALNYGLSTLLRLPLKAWRISRRRQSSFGRALRYLLQGGWEAAGVLRRNHDTLW
ncbi:MAG: glycosyltransferase [Muribaculum sp.]|nr:glycosyltransferase [Muribaculum sp.]